MDQGAATEILLRKENQRCRKRKVLAEIFDTERTRTINEI